MTGSQPTPAQAFEPSQMYIQEMCRLIRNGWDEEEEKRRRVWAVPKPVETPVVRVWRGEHGECGDLAMRDPLS